LLSERWRDISERAIFALIIFYFATLFFSKMETLRTVALFSAFFLWLLDIKRRDFSFLRNPISIFFYGMILTIGLSYFVSFKPQETLSQLKGEPLKALLLYTLFASIRLSDERLYLTSKIAVFSIIVILLSGFYTFFFVNKLFVMSSNTFILYAGSNRYPYFILYYLPFVLYIAFNFKNQLIRNFSIVIIILSIIAYVASSYRIGLAALFLFILFWIYFLNRLSSYNVRKYLISVTLIIAISVVIFYFSVPTFKAKIYSFSEHLSTFTYRTTIWEKIILAFKEKPILGWGWGDELIEDENLFKTLGTSPPDWRGHHSMFLRMLFHTGIIGFIFYFSLVFFAVYKLLKEAYAKKSEYLFLLTICSIILCNFIFIGFFDSYKSLHWLAIIVGMGVSALNYKRGD